MNDDIALLRELLAELREQTAQLRSLRLDLAEGRGAADVRLGLLLRAVDAAIGDAPTTAAELVALADEKLSTRIALCAAVEAITARAADRAKSLGHFLRNSAGKAADGLRLARVRGCVYRVSRIESDESPARQHWPSKTKGRSC